MQRHDQARTMKLDYCSAKILRITGQAAIARLEPHSPICVCYLAPCSEVTAAAIFNRILAMKTERFAGHHEAAHALWLAAAGVTAIMLVANLVLLILY